MVLQNSGTVIFSHGFKYLKRKQIGVFFPYFFASNSEAFTIVVGFNYRCDEFGPPGWTFFLKKSSSYVVDRRNVCCEQPSSIFTFFTLHSYPSLKLYGMKKGK